MNMTPEFYAMRVEQAETEAKEATLDNVRERALRSAETWKMLGNQARKTAENRAKAQRERNLAEQMLADPAN